jgi:hypothetical protein
VWGRPFLDHPRLEEELAELLKRRLQFPHDPSPNASTQADFVGVPPASPEDVRNADLRARGPPPSA